MKYGGVLILCTSVLFVVSIVNCQWVVNIKIHQLQNNHSSVLHGNQFCCCDNTACRDSISDVSECKKLCDTWFKVSLIPCPSVGSCSASTEVMHKTPMTVSLNYTLTFFLHTFPDELTVNIIVYDIDGKKNEEIDKFSDNITTSSTIQHSLLTGNNKIATIELSYQVACVCSEMTACSEQHSSPVETSNQSQTTTSTSQNDEKTQTAWMAVAGLFVAVTVVLFFTNIATACFLYWRIVGIGKEYSRKGNTSEKRENEETSDPIDYQEIQCSVDNVLYLEGRMSSHHYIESGPTEAVVDNFYDMANPVDEDSGCPYETPLSLSTKEK